MKTKAKILVIDDEQGIRDMLAYALLQQGYEIVTISSGEEGIKRVREEKFDVVISDIKMPGIDGITVLGEIKKINSEIEVIMATGYGTMETVVESLRKGAFDYVNKPFNIDEVIIVIERALEKTRFRETILLYEISKAIFSTINLDELLKIIIDSTMKVLKADDASLMLFDDTEKLFIAISYGLSEEIQKNTRLALGERVAGWVAENKQPIVLIDGLENDKRFKDIEHRENIKSSIVLPLIGKEKILGVLNINRINISEHFTENDLQRANIFVSLVSLSLENANLYKKIQMVQEQYIRQAKLASIGELASGLAHEVGNPLQTILGNVDLLLMDNKSEELLAIKDASLRTKNIIENLLDFSRQKEMKFAVADVNNLIDKTFLLYGKQLELKNIRIVKNYQKDLPNIRLSPSHIEQIFLNLIINAQNAMPEGGTIIVTTATKPEDSTHVIISFKDTGIGISKENKVRIFEPFFTTHKNGTGLGLSVSYGIIKQHNGEISVQSEGKDKGAEFIIKLPIKSTL